jgi:hypothetical protein
MSFPPPTTPYPSAQPAKIKPGKGWYWLGGLLVAGGILGGLAIGIAGVVRLVKTIEDFGRFKVADGSGTAQVSFKKPGKYSIYYEWNSKVCQNLAAGTGGSCQTEKVSAESHDPPSRLDISISNDNGSLDVKPTENSYDYDFGDYGGTEVATVQVDNAGSYTMTVESDRTSAFGIALGKGVVSSILPWIAVAALVGLLGLALGLVTLIVTGVKRGRRKRAAAAAVTAYPGIPAPEPVPASAWAPAPAPYGPPVGPAGPAPTSPPAPPPPSGGWAPPPPPAPGGPAPGGPAPGGPAPGQPLPPPPPSGS